ncbi:inositol-tetrakisphosphate 1-kinase 4 [Brachypodium distachyon]|uniref:Inositol-tetrakisphosphate 1-kinase n=1 Tax=Brachypodium distachyon TaxID=15368 RepID=I1I9K6_BRADI|nr:inositol-tetrakisphosphate 1-kinase 4 [Brachypodium distachyon]KQJ99418.1 hypothetical protein BRADI_3g43150v3 [Brachypodium distachyon]|eukprot:XP_003572515.1 inositol-tetrakisphosphate 1-kinase 4 [Brachypodium distachyon]
MVTEQSSAASGPGPAYSYTIGYALPPSKVESVIQPSLVSLAAERGMRLVAVDALRPLAEQGPLDLLIHKRYDKPWRAQLEAFSALHPSVPVVDPPAAILRLVDRLAMLDVVSELHPVAVNSAAGAPAAEYCLSVPNQVAVHDAAALASYGADQEDHPLGALRFPLIAKPLAVDGSAGSHAMSLVYRREGLREVQAPVVLQEFVNHGGVLFKVYVVGGRATCVRRRSLPDVPAERLLDLGQDASVPFANISNLPPTADSTAAPGGGADDKGGPICGDNDVEMPPACFVDEVSRGLRRALGLNLFNFDLIRATELDGDGRRRYFIIDINYFPGYAKMPGYETALTDFFSEMLRARPPVDDAHL